MSNTQKKNVPELRFPGFEGEWEEKQFADFTKINQGLQIAINERKTEYSPELYFYITNEFLRPNSQTKYFIEKPPQSVIANKEDILMTRTGNTGKVVTNVFGAFHNNFFKIKFDKNLYDRLFLVEVLNSSKIQNKILSLAGSSTIPDLNHSDFYSISSSYPLLREQQKIGKFFSKLDRQIELEEQKLELLKQQKKGYMQKIFSQELRFKDENGNDYPDWEEKKMGAITTMFSGGTPQSTNTRYYKGDIPFIRSGEISKTYTELKINEEALNNSSAKLVEVGDLLYALYGATSGEVAISKINGAINQAVLCIRTNESVEFLLNYLFFSKNKILNTFIQGGQGNLSANIIKNLIIETPTIIEQRKIADFFGIIDNLIEIQERKLEFLKQRKQSLLQKMFV
ncbi:TPA: restriction endonuclease subunit S [Staphylococcus aureus]|nr:restriction endonuclease subunit S [Staphylococcus aureus]HDA2752090.1 restriction endonuclease subunit S [Staphylococcus aureus]HDA2807861.1 restriction endonuclease subunit S [Staphylococcus aureus]HDJ1544983.1 restriction endonuclease subunit S [Staphylococcus aureus]HEI2067090.1 restriction endonuclease subunit S [Staphylococcus aureus]